MCLDPRIAPPLHPTPPASARATQRHQRARHHGAPAFPRREVTRISAHDAHHRHDDYSGQRCAVPRVAHRGESEDIDAHGYQPMARAVAQNIREAIYDGTLKPGEPVRQEAIAQSLGTSRIPVREALRQLEAEGLVTVRPHASARVAVLDFDECVELYKMRERMEPLAFAESVRNISEDQVAHSDVLCRQIEGLTKDPAAWIDADRRFHLATYDALPFNRLRRTVQDYWNITQQYRRIVVATFTESDFLSFQAEHMLIVDAMRTRNIRAGEDLVRMAIERARLRLEENRQLFDI